MSSQSPDSGTRIDEVGSGLFRISTPFDGIPGGFSFNQYLLVDEAPLLFHTGFRAMFPLVREAIERVMPVERLRYVAFSHFETDECGAVNEFLAVAPRAEPLCGRVNAMINAGAWDRAPVALADGEALSLGERRVRWLDAPHVPHGWECGFLFEESSRALLCGDLFTQPGFGRTPLTTEDVLEPSEAFRGALGDYFAHSPATRSVLERLADLGPTRLACMHGSAWEGDGGALLRALADRLAPSAAG